MWSIEVSILSAQASVYVFSLDGGTQHWLVGPDVGGPATPAGGGRSGGGGGRHWAQHAAAETQEQHLVSWILYDRPGIL